MKKSVLFVLAFILYFGINSGYAQTALPYAINFGQSQTGWTAVDQSATTGTTWQFLSNGSYIQGTYYPCVVLKQDYSSACNDYYVSPAFSLKAGTTYTIVYNACAWNNGNGAVLTIERGTSNSNMSTFTSLQNVTLDENWIYPVAQQLQISVPTDGTYYFAFHSTSPQYNSEIHLFEFKLYEGEATAETPEEVVEAVPYSVDLRTDYADWTAADNNADGSTWTASGSTGIMLGMALSGQHDDDYFSPKITLTGGVTYKITTNVAMNSESIGYDIITLTQGTDKTKMTAIKQLTLTNAGETTEENFFTPSASGDYYFSFHNTSTTGGNTLAIYSFAIEEYVPETPDETEVYNSDFSGTNPLQGWTIIDANSDNVKWGIESGFTGPTYLGSSVSSSNDWLITPALSLTNGKDYLIRYSLSQSGAFDADQMEIKWGTTATAAGMTTLLATESIEFETGEGTVEKTVRLKATSTGNAYIGFHLITPTSNGTLTLNWITVSETTQAKPMAVEDLKATSSSTEKSVTLNWKNPSYDVTDAPILSGLDIIIYENGTKITTLTDREPGAKDTWTYKPTDFSGETQYKVVASLNGVESLPVEVSINLDDISGEEVNVWGSTSVNDFGYWKIENTDGGTTWTQITYDAGGLSMNYAKNCNDWAISPGVTLEAGKRYVVKFNVSTGTNYPGTLNVYLGTSQTATAMTTKLISLENIAYNGYVATTTPQFSVQTNGTYYIGFQATNVGNNMRINNVEVCYIQEVQTGGDVPTMEIPYTQNFDQNTSTPEGWLIERSSTEYGFNVCNVKSSSKIFGTKAYSGSNALFAAGDAPEAKEEVIYTPMFSLEPNKTYTVSFMLYMLIQYGEPSHEVSLYKATAQSQDAIVGDALIFTNSAPQFSWAEQKTEFTVTASGNYCFAIKVNTPDAGGGEVIIDDFSIKAEDVVIEPVTPAAILNVEATALSTSQSVIFDWNLPRVDVDGNDIPQGSIVTTQIYDGDELIAEPTVTMPDPSTINATTGLATTYTYTYSDYNKFSGQKIYKLVPRIEDKVGPATACVLSISSFTDGYLKERTYVADFTTGDNNWQAVDNDNDGTTWTHDGTVMTTSGTDEWLISPEITLNVGKSYYVLCEFKAAYNQSVDITFTRGNAGTVAAQTETIHSFNDLIMNKYVVMEIGTNFNADSESNYFGIHVQSESGTKIELKDFKVMRLFTQDEPEELPYEQDFENRIDINEMTLFTNKWGCRTSSASPFKVTTMPDGTVAAHSGSYAAVANEFTLNGRTETLYTPYFTLQEGHTYEISYWLYMPGNGDNITTGQLIEAYTQDESGIELPVIQEIKTPVTEWKQFVVRYTPSYDMEYCFYFEFTASAANAGIIAIDDFKIAEVDGTTGIADVNTAGMYYAHTTSLLYLPAEIESVRIFNMQGQQMLAADNTNGHVSLTGLNSGVYVVRAITTEGEAMSLKVIKK